MIGLTKKEYEKIARKLNINKQTDLEAALTLNSLINENHFKESLNQLKSKLSDKTVFIFGAGPSLLKSIQLVKQNYKSLDVKPIILAVDGATKALLDNSLQIDIIVTDLDGSIEAIRKSYQQKKSLLVIHAHGDNQTKISEIKDILDKERIIGSTQIEEMEYVKNFGGFSDGDRAVYLAANFNAKKIVLFGFDFGEIVGRFSKPNEYLTNFLATKRKKTKFKFAKKLLNKAVKKFPNTTFLNCTSNGERIKNFKKMKFDQLKEII